jgi:hypothetical protein
VLSLNIFAHTAKPFLKQNRPKTGLPSPNNRLLTALSTLALFTGLLFNGFIICLTDF